MDKPVIWLLGTETVNWGVKGYLEVQNLLRNTISKLCEVLCSRY